LIGGLASWPKCSSLSAISMGCLLGRVQYSEDGNLLPKRLQLQSA
jgi:hypothetical protein